MKILIFSLAFLPAESYGGVPFSVFFLSKGLLSLGHDVRIITSDRDGGGRVGVPCDVWTEYSGIPVIYCSTWKGPYLFSPSMSRIAEKEAKLCDVIISASTLWTHIARVAHEKSKRFGIPHIIYTHGLLDPWALKFKRYRKIIFWILQGRRILSQASRIVALNNSEKKSIQKLNINTPIDVIPNGVDPDGSQDAVSREELERLYPGLKGKKFILCMARIYQKKGFDVLLPAFHKAFKDSAEPALVICGLLEREYKNVFFQMLNEYRLSGKVLITSSVKGRVKNGFFRHAAGFILTSRSEGMPRAALEAMAAGLPVIISEQCNIPEVRETDSGWVVRTREAEVAEALQELFNDHEKREKKGKNAKKLIMDNFTWPTIGKKTSDMLQSASKKTSRRI